MNITTAPQRSERPDTGIPDPLQQLPLPHRTARTALLDRIALRLALALLLWSTRPQRAALTAVQRRELHERERRELAWQLRCHRLPLI